MQSNQILALIKKKITSILLFGVLVAALSFAILLIKEKNFKVSTDYLITQNQTGSQDFYTLSKSAEYVGKILNEGIYSELFVNEVIKTGKVNPEFLPFDKKAELTQWGNTVQASLNPDLGILTVQVFDNDQKQAGDIADATADVLTSDSSLFIGEGQNVDVKVLSGPVIEKNPSIANIIAVVIAGFVLGILLSVLWFVARDEKRKKELFMKPVSKTNEPSLENQVSSQLAAVTSIERMDIAGNFLSEEQYMESFRQIDQR